MLGLIAVFLLLLSTPAWSALTDSAVHAPPTSGTFAYNTFVPGSAGFPALGGTYVDPVFGETVRRVTDGDGTANDDDIYAHHWCNANGTACFSTDNGVLRIYSPLTGATLYNNQPTGSGNLPRANLQWHPTDPDKYQRFENARIVERSLLTQTDVTLFTAPQTFDNYGGSLPWVSADGDVFVVAWGGKGHVWKRSTNTLYTGETSSFVPNGGWISITPDGNYIVTASGGSSTPQRQHWSFAINHGTASVSVTPIQFWGLCGDHGVLSSASDGHNYFITYACHNTPGLWRADITLDQAGKSEDQQLAANKNLIPLAWQDNDGHLSGNMAGALRDWVFLDTENLTGDPYNGSVTGWTAWKQEIIAINVATREVRRLAHHRSRSLSSNYYSQPRISSSWDGSVAIWASNFNKSSPSGYVDIYAIQFTTDGTPPPVDTDNDGVSDSADGCPAQPGPASNNGCPVPLPPDTDSDGVPDTQDPCPTVPGPTSNNGCPILQLDQDGDGVPDDTDICKTQPGPASNNGCPLPAPTGFVLTVTTSGAGGSVTSEPNGIACPGVCAFNYAAGTIMQLTVTVDPTAIFKGWSGACSGTGACTVTMNTNTTVKATFKVTERTRRR